jgi:hypothetical protein
LKLPLAGRIGWPWGDNGNAPMADET